MSVGPVDKCGWWLRQVHHEGVGEPVHHDPRVYSDTFLPHNLDTRAVFVRQAHITQRIRERIEPRRAHHSIELSLRIFTLTLKTISSRSKEGDGTCIQVQNLHILLIQHLVVVMLQQRSFRAK